MQRDGLPWNGVRWEQGSGGGQGESEAEGVWKRQEKLLLEKDGTDRKEGKQLENGTGERNHLTPAPSLGQEDRSSLWAKYLFLSRPAGGADSNSGEPQWSPSTLPASSRQTRHIHTHRALNPSVYKPTRTTEVTHCKSRTVLPHQYGYVGVLLLIKDQSWTLAFLSPLLRIMTIQLGGRKLVEFQNPSRIPQCSTKKHYMQISSFLVLFVSRIWGKLSCFQ